MEEQNANGASLAAENNPPQKPKNSFSIVGYNLAILAVYTIFSRLIGNDGFVIDALLLAIHVFTCLILALANKSWMWVLAGVLVLVIGFSTCVYGLGLDN